jgi:hypothetical protein
MTERTLIIIKPDAVQRQLIKPFFEGVVRYLSSAPVLVLVLEAEGVIAMSRKLMGETFGNEATPGTIRGDFGACRGYNLLPRLQPCPRLGRTRNSRIRNGFVFQARRNRRLQARRRRLALRQQ